MSPTPAVLTRFLSAWSERDPQLAANEVTGDVRISDPHGVVEGPAGLVEHLELILRRFDFPPAQITNCFVDGQLDGAGRIAFVMNCPMIGRSSRLSGIETAFEAAVFVELTGGKISSWTEYWDPAPLARSLTPAPGAP